MFTIKQCVLILLLITACSKARNAPEGSSRQLEEVATRRDLAWFLPGSCDGACGHQSKSGSCFCDTACSSYGDCCSDYIELCVTPPTQEFQCAAEKNWGCPECTMDTTCECPNGKVKYGYGNKWTEWVAVDTTIECTNGVFGDPYWGQHKICMCSQAQSMCQGYCGTKNTAAGCWCDSLCESYDDCCPGHEICKPWRRELGEVENTEKNGRRNLAEIKNKQGSAQRLLKI